MLADASVCFINAEGGAIVLGVDDKATERSDALVGVPAAYTPDVIRKGIFDRTRPPITPLVSEEMVDGVRLLVVTVPQGVLPHSNSAGLATKRLGQECACPSRPNNSARS
jgi:ATP-dependent DNA helicase RecG